ncbi:MAG: precorrin-6A reductase [Synergistaceae bacterium]|jgi:cobalt-precorrin 5A hydrolase/precorrin-3B C17-methyltransferase|nr:precorrin-6A reductase [Synergistaceae bacterium]
MRYRTDKAIYVLHYEGGAEIASELCGALSAEGVLISDGGTKDAFASRWEGAGAFVFIGALAIAVRSVAGLLKDKAEDPALVAVSEDGGVSLPVISGHIGLATDLARECAQALSSRGALYVPTTSSDRAGFTAPDLWAARRGYHILLRSRLASAIMKLKASGSINVWIDPILTEHGISFPLPFGYKISGEQHEADIIVSPRAIQKLSGAKPQIVPRVVTAGIGCRQGIGADVIERVLKSALSSNFNGPFLVEAMAGFRTVEAKRGEAGIAKLAASYAMPLVIVPDEEILSAEGDFSPSAASRHIGLPGAAEPAAATAGQLLGARVAESGVTVALSLSMPVEEGELAVVGIGPGDPRFVTMEARSAIDASDVVIGYGLYVDLLPETWKRGKVVERYGMGEEESRVSRALSYAEYGYRVALVSGGDASLFGIASLCLSMASSDSSKNIRVIPGITAAQAAGALAGAPYSNGLALVSLSDYLQKWGDVVRSLEGACESGLSVAVYNPVSRNLDEHLSELRRIFAGRRALLFRDAGRAGGSVAELPVEEIGASSVDMRTMMLILSPASREKYLGGKKFWVEARGYPSETARAEGEPGKPESLGQFLVLGGTTEGRSAASCLTQSGFSVSVSVTRDAGAATVPDGARALIGPRDSGGWAKLFGDGDARADLLGVIDATHPFAENASAEIASACGAASIPLCRFAREEDAPQGAIIAQDLQSAVKKAIDATSGDDVIFLAIGTKGLKTVMPLLRSAGRGVLARMLPTAPSIAQASACLDPREIVAMWGAGDADFNEALCRGRNVRCIVSRESGPPGGVAEKAAAAARLGIPLVLIKRPAENPMTTRVMSKDELLSWCRELAAGK